MKLRRFKPIGKGKSILILPPNAGHHSAIADYSDNQSLVQLLIRFGFDVYVAEWRNATPRYKNVGIADYIRYTDEAVNKIIKLNGYGRVNIIGQCQGGWQAAIYTSLNNEKVDKLVVAASPIDFNYERGFMNDYVDTLPLDFYRYLVSLGGGVMKGGFIVIGFKNAQPIESYITKYLRLWNYILEEDETAVNRFEEFNDWYEYTQDLPGRFYLEVIEGVFKKNGLVTGVIEINNAPVNLRNIDRPLILVTGAKDHITPPGQCAAMKLYVSTSSNEIYERQTQGGHIGTLMGRKALENEWTEIANILRKGEC